MYRIGIDARMYRPGSTGIGRYIKELTDHLFEIDQENEYVLFLNEKAYHSYTCPNSRVSKRHTKADYYSVSEQTIFLQELNRENLDLVHFTHFNAPILYNGSSVVTIHDLTLSKFPGQKMNTPIHRIAYNMTIQTVTKKAKKIISVSKHTAHDIEKILKINKEKIQVIYEGISDEFQKVTDKKLIDKSKEKYRITKPFFLYVGVWRNHKNLVHLVEAFNIYRQKYNKDIQLVITGREDSKNYPEVRNAINKCDLNNDVVTPGFVDEDDLINLYSGAEALVNPSFYEGFGFPPLEALACGTIPVVSDASCHKEICQNHAIYFDPNNINDIADKLNDSVTNKTIIDKVMKDADKYVKTFNWDKNAKETFELYMEVISNKNKKHNNSDGDKSKTSSNQFSPLDSIKWVVGGLKNSNKNKRDVIKKDNQDTTSTKSVDINTKMSINKKSKELEEKANKTALGFDKKSDELINKAKEEKDKANKEEKDKQKKILKMKASALEEAAKKLKEASTLLKATSKELENKANNGNDESIIDVASKRIEELKSKGEDIFKEHFGMIRKTIEEISDKVGEISVDIKDDKK